MLQIFNIQKESQKIRICYFANYFKSINDIEKYHEKMREKESIKGLIHLKKQNIDLGESAC